MQTTMFSFYNRTVLMQFFFLSSMHIYGKADEKECRFYFFLMGIINQLIQVWKPSQIRIQFFSDFFK